jgi:ketosteroid isomerase-like protein
MRPAAPSWTRNTGRAMSEENVQIVRRVFDALQHPNAAVRALWHPDVEFDVSRDIWGALVGGGRYRGVEGVRGWMLDLYSGWEKMDLSCEELIDVGEQVIAVLSVRGRGRVSGIELETAQPESGRSARARSYGSCGSAPARKPSDPWGVQG